MKKTLSKIIVLFFTLCALTANAANAQGEISYQNTFSTPEQIAALNLTTNPGINGTYSWDEQRNLLGYPALKMTTNPDEQPYYFFLFEDRPYTGEVITLETFGAISANTESFGIGWQVIKDNQLFVMFTRLNYANGNIEALEGTAPHTWHTVGAIPFNVRRDNVLQPFFMTVKIDPATMQYLEFSFHAVCLINGVNKWTYPMTLQAINPQQLDPDNPPDNRMVVKINPQGKLGVSATAWLWSIKTDED